MIVRTICALALTLSIAAPAAARSSELPAEVATTVAEAAARPGIEYLRTVAIETISDHPELARAVITRIHLVAPERAEVVAAAVKRAFPHLPSSATGVPPEHRPDDNGAWSGEIELGGSRATGNTETEALAAAAKLKGVFGRWEQAFTGSLDFARDEGETSKQRLLVDSKTSYRLSERLYGFGFLEYEDDRFSGFDYTLTESAGLGYRLIDTEPFTFTIEAGPGARHSKISHTGETENELIGRVNGVAEWRVSENAKFTNDTNVVIGEERITTRNLTALTAKVVGDPAARLSFEVRHDDNPPQDAEALDTLTKASLVYGF